MKLEDVSALFNWEKIKKVSPVVLWGILTYVHSALYVPHLAKALIPEIEKDLKTKVIKDVNDSLKASIIKEVRHQDITLSLQLSKELNVPIYKIPRVISKSVSMTDSARSFQYIIDVVEGVRRVTDVGLKVDRSNSKNYFLKPDGTVGDAYSDNIGIYRFTAKGEKYYLYKN